MTFRWCKEITTWQFLANTANKSFT